MPPRPIEQKGQELKHSATALREARAQLRPLDRLAATVDAVGDERAAAMVAQIRATLEQQVGDLIAELSKDGGLVRLRAGRQQRPPPPLLAVRLLVLLHQV